MGGSVRAALNVSKGLVEHGADVVVAATEGPGDSLDYLARDYANVRYELFPRASPTHNFRSPSLHRWLRGNVGDFDVVEIHGTHNFVPLYTSWTCRGQGAPYVVRPHGSLEPFDLEKHSLPKRIYGPLVVRPMLDHAESLVLTSELEAERVVTYGARPQKVVVPLPVEPLRGNFDGPGFRARYRIPADAFVVLFLGRIDYKKGLPFLVASLARLKSEWPSLWFLLAGGGEASYVSAVDDLLARHGMTSWTTRCGFVSGDAKASAFAASDLFALPSLNENFGIVVVEAMHAGLPLLVSDEVHIHDAVAAGGAGVVCKPSAESCYDSLRALLRDPEKLSAMATRSRELAQYFAPEAATRTLLRLYDDVIDRHRNKMFLVGAERPRRTRDVAGSAPRT